MEKIIGINPVMEALGNRDKAIEKIEIFQGLREEKIKEIKRKASERNIKVQFIKKKVENSQGVIAYVSEYNYYVEVGEFLEKVASKSRDIILVLDGVQDPRNFGAIIRSSEIFGVSGIIIPERKSVSINEAVIKTSTGAIEYVDIIKVVNISQALEKLKKLGYWIYGAEGSGQINYNEEKYPQKTVLILGSEGFGIRRKVKENCDILIKIPMYGKINSLNVSVAGGILLSEIAKFVY